MNTEIKVKGMHCEACKTLIRMELEDAGLENNISAIELAENMTGIVVLNDADSVQVENAINTINKLNNYSVIN